MTGAAKAAGSAVGEDELRQRVARLSVGQKVRLLTGADFWALYPEPDAGLRRLVTSDGPAGVRGGSVAPAPPGSPLNWTTPLRV